MDIQGFKPEPGRRALYAVLIAIAGIAGSMMAPPAIAGVPSSDWSILISDDVTTVSPGGSVQYTIQTYGFDAVSGATVTDTFPPELTCTWTCVSLVGAGSCTASGSGNINDTISLSGVFPSSVRYTATCQISPTATGTITNTASITLPNTVIDTAPSNNTATDINQVVSPPDVSITKTDGVTSVTPNTWVNYTIVASNPGPSTVSANVTDTFPASLANCSWSCTPAGGAGCTLVGAGNMNASVTLPAGGTATYAASCFVKPDATGTIANTATIVPIGITDPNPANNSATDTDTVTAPTSANVSGTMAVAGGTTPGSTVTYTAVLTNNGSGNQADNEGEEFGLVLDSRLTFVSVAASSGTTRGGPGAANMLWDGAIAPGASATITAVARLNPGATGRIAAQGAIYYDSNGDGTNDAMVTTDDPNTVALGDATAFVAGGDPTVFTVVPGLTPLGLAVLALGLMFAGMRRRRID